MKINKWIPDVFRMQISRSSREPNKRYDCAERTVNFDDELYKEFLATLSQEDFITYPSYQQYWDLKDRIASLHNEYDGTELTRENVYVDSGSDACIKCLIQMTCQENSEIIASFPCFPMYFVYGETFGANFVPVNYDDNLKFDLSDMTEAINEKTRFVILTNPNSPYGDFRPISEIEELCKYTQDKNLVLLIDEAYADFAPDNCTKLLEKYDNVVVSRTFSKGWGGAGTRVGYLLGNKEIIENVSKVGLTYPITGPSLKFVNFLLDNKTQIKEYINETVEERIRLSDALENAGYDVVRSHTNTIHFHEKEGDNSDSVATLQKHGISFKCGQEKTGTAVRVPGDERTTWIRLSIGPNMLESEFIKDLLSQRDWR
jgi:histidinol-phosphate aminotransferase